MCVYIYIFNINVYGMGRFLSAAGCTLVTSDEIWVGSVAYVAPYSLPSNLCTKVPVY